VPHKKNGQRRYKLLVVGRDKSYFAHTHTQKKKAKAKKKNKQTTLIEPKSSLKDIIKMLEFLIDNIFAMFGGCAFQQTFGIPSGSN